jgi:hypothetical protein
MKTATASFYVNGKKVSTLTVEISASLVKALSAHAFYHLSVGDNIDQIVVDGIYARSAGKIQREVRAFHSAISGVVVVAV